MKDHLHHQLPHQRLDVWTLALALVREVRAQRITNADLRDQATRAATSAALNLAEGAARNGRDGARHFLIARASAAEVVAAYEVAEALGESTELAKIRELGTRIAAMLTRLAR
jgi:four helix bundle protein